MRAEEFAGLIGVEPSVLLDAIEKAAGLAPDQSVVIVPKSLCRREVSTLSKQDVFRKIEHEAEQLMAADPSLMREEAIAKVAEQRPDLADDYAEADAARVAPVVEKRVQTPRTAAADVIDAHVQKMAAELGIGVADAYDRYLASPEGAALVERYQLARG